jgi:hypothetical protein
MEVVMLTYSETAETVEELARKVAEFARHLPVPNAVATDSSAKEQSLVARKVSIAWGRIGTPTRRWLVAAAEAGEWTNETIATTLNESRTQTRNRAANFGRTMKGVNAALNDDGRLYRWDAERQTFTMDFEARQAVLNVATRDGLR